MVILKTLEFHSAHKTKSREPAYLQAINQNKIHRLGSRSRESGSQSTMVDGVWDWVGEGGGEEEECKLYPKSNG